MPCGTCVRYEYQCEYAPGKRQSSHHLNGDNPPEIPNQQSWPETHDVKPSVIQLQAHPLTAPGARFHHRSILDPVKTRFVRANSAIAFPRILGMDMESESIPRLHSFGWCMGIRQEEQDPVFDISTIVSWIDMQRLAAVYFAIVKPELGLLEERATFSSVQPHVIPTLAASTSLIRSCSWLPLLVRSSRQIPILRKRSVFV
jgi:hypothetical protein